MGIAARIGNSGESPQTIEVAALRAENLQLSEDLERLRLQQAGAHPGAAFAQAMRSMDLLGDTADETVTMYTSSMLIRSELLALLHMLKETVAGFEQRLENLDHRAQHPLAEPQAAMSPFDTASAGADALLIGERDSNNVTIDLRSSTGVHASPSPVASGLNGVPAANQT